MPIKRVTPQARQPAVAMRPRPALVPPPVKAAAPARKPESVRVVTARQAVTAAANDFEEARAEMAAKGQALQDTPGSSPHWDKVHRAFIAAKDAYAGAGHKLSDAQQALADAQAVAK